MRCPEEGRGVRPTTGSGGKRGAGRPLDDEDEDAAAFSTRAQMAGSRCP